MLLSLLFLSVFTQAKTEGCSLSQILKQAKPDQTCVARYLAKIPNAEDRSEAKFRLQQWRPIKDLEVRTQSGMIEAFQKDKLILRTILLQKQKPMLIYMNGKILVDNSDNPSFARRLDNALKKNRSALLNLVLPQAHALDIKDTQQTLTVLYTLEGGGHNDAGGLVEKSESLEEFLPPRSWVHQLLSKSRKIRCGEKNLLAPTSHAELAGSREGYENRDMTITPRSPTEFIITHFSLPSPMLITLDSMKETRGRRQVISLPGSRENATISACVDSQCLETSAPESVREWNKKSEGVTFDQDRIDQLFGLSVLGECCAQPECAPKLEQRFNIQLQKPKTVGAGIR